MLILTQCRVEKIITEYRLIFSIFILTSYNLFNIVYFILTTYFFLLIILHIETITNELNHKTYA